MGVETGADYVMKCEDDLDFIADFIGSTMRWIADHENPRVGMFVLGHGFANVSACRYAHPEESVLGPGESFSTCRKLLAQGQTGVAGPVRSGFWGAQALVWRRKVAIELLEWLGPDPYYLGMRGTERAPFRDRGHDLLLGQWGINQAWWFATPVPSFVQHIGVESTLKNKFFQFPWPGREWKYHAKVAVGL